MSDSGDAAERNVKDSARTISNEAERQKLLEDIKRMKDRVYELQSSISIYRFSELELEKDSSDDSSSCSENDFLPRDVNVEIQDELFQLAGIRCSRFEEDCVFEFRAGNSARDGGVYCVQILNDNGSGKVGKSYMPIGLDIEEITNANPVEEFRKVKPFLRSCKRYLHCYFARQRQCLEMKRILSTVKNCTCEWNTNGTAVWYNIYGVRILETAETFDVTLHLLYKLEETLPYKLCTDVHAKGLPDNLDKLLNSYYKCFKEMKLKDAFEEIVGNRSTTFSWTKIESFALVNDDKVSNQPNFDSTGSENEFSILLNSQRKEKRKKRGKAAKDETRREQSTHFEESLENDEKSMDHNEEDVEETDLLETTKRKSAGRAKKTKKKVEDSKQQTILNFGVKAKKRETEKKVKTINDNGETIQNEYQDAEKNIGKKQTKKNPGSKKVDSVAKNFEPQSGDAERMTVKQLEKTSKTVNNIEAKKTKRFEQLYRELNEIKEKKVVNNMDREESPETSANEEDDATNKYNAQNKQDRSNRKHQFNKVTDNCSESDSDNESPKKLVLEYQSNNAANPESTTNERKTQIVKKNEIGNRFMSYLDESDSETSSESANSDGTKEEQDGSTTNELRTNVSANVSKNQRHCSTLLTPTTSEDTESMPTKYKKNRQHVKRKKLSLIQEIGTDTEDQIDRSVRIEPIRSTERKEGKGSNQKVRSILTPRSLDGPVSVRFSTPLSSNETQSGRETKIAPGKFRRLEQIREQDPDNVEVANSTPIRGDILKEVNFSELAEISNIGSEKDGRVRVSEKGPEGGSSDNGRRKRKLFEDGRKSRRTSEIREAIEEFRKSLSKEKDDPVEGKKKKHKSASKAKKMAEPGGKKGKNVSKDGEAEPSECSRILDERSHLVNKDKNEDKSGESGGVTKMSKDKAKKRKISHDKSLGDSQTEEEGGTNSLLNRNESRRDKSVERGKKIKRISEPQDAREKVSRKHMEESSANSGSEEIVNYKNSNFFSKGKRDRGKSVERNKNREIPKLEEKKLKISFQHLEPELCQESENDEDLNNNSLSNSKNERGKSVERKRKKSKVARGREEESSADSDNGQKKKNKEFIAKDRKSRDKSVERDRARKLLKSEAKKRKALQTNQESESSESEVVMNESADNPTREDRIKRGKSLERNRSRKLEIDAKEGKTFELEKISNDGVNEKMNNSRSDHKHKRSKSVERKKAEHLLKREVKKRKIVDCQQGGASSEESDINEKRKNVILNPNEKKRHRSVERKRQSFGKRKVEDKENNPLSQNKNKRSKSVERSKSREKIINIDKRNAKDNWSEIVNTDSSDHYLSDEDTFNDKELLKDLAYIKEAGELKTTTKYKKNIKKKTKKYN